jgi:hypothetical protein
VILDKHNETEYIVSVQCHFPFKYTIQDGSESDVYIAILHDFDLKLSMVRVMLLM